jgi:hypothetical protein
MGQQSNKVLKRRRRVNYLKRKKLASKTAVAKVTTTAKPASAPAKKAKEAKETSKEHKIAPEKAPAPAPDKPVPEVGAPAATPTPTETVPKGT